MADEHFPDDPYFDLVARFVARGATVRPGNQTQDMLKHLLDSLEEAESRTRGVEDALRRAS